MEVKLNLIPNYKKEEIKAVRRLKLVFKWEFQLTAILFIFATILFSISYILKMNLLVVTSNSGMQANNKYREIEKYDAEVKEANARIAELEKIQTSQLYWSKFFLRFNARVSEGIEIENLATNNYTVSLAGKADTRDKLIAFKEGLELEECFTDVKLPLSNLVSKDDAAFQMDFNLKAECLK